MAFDLLSIDWTQPWLAPWREVGQRVAACIAQGALVSEALNRQAQASVQFVPQAQLPPGMAYEQFIFETGCCPTRENAHDFFNGLCWLQFPQIKKRLNELQAEQIATQGIAATRGPVRDALTLFDENAALLIAPASLWQSLLNKDWQQLFVQRREVWREAQLVLFGHALIEKLLTPRKPIVAHAYWVGETILSIAELDTWVAADLSAQKLGAKPFAPLPVLGVPGWWAPNEDVVFYADAQVFRRP